MVWIGAHVSAAGGVANAVKNAAEIGAHAFAFFTRSQRKWNSPALTPESIENFKNAMKEHDFSPSQIVPHGSYLMNCGSPDETTLEKSRNALLDEVERCEQLGLLYYNFHPGSTTGKCSVEESIIRIADSINTVHQETKRVVILIENMSRQGSTIGGEFEHLRDIILRVKDSTRIGVCFDTCHAFAAGFDLSTRRGYDETFAAFDEIVGLQHLKAFHLNDSKGQVGCCKDRHEKIGKGYIGLETFEWLVNDQRFREIPMILETPVSNKKDPNPDYAEEIQTLYSLITATNV